MRKYFLLSAVAILMTTTANAENYTNLEISANVEMATKINCSALNFGNIVIASSSDNFTETVTITGDLDEIIIEKSENVISVDNYSPASCSGYGTNVVNFPDSVTLTNENGKTVTVSNFKSLMLQAIGHIGIGATLTLTRENGEDISGAYTGSVTLVGFNDIYNGGGF